MASPTTGLTPGAQATLRADIAASGQPATQAQIDALTMNAQPSPPTFTERMTKGASDFYDNYLSPSRGQPGTAKFAEETAKLQQTLNVSADKAADLALEAAPGVLRAYAPLAAAGTAALAMGTDFFETPEPDEPVDYYENQVRYADMTPEERRMYQLRGLDPMAYQGGNYGVAYNRYNPYLQQAQNRRVRRAASGGIIEKYVEMYPRRMGHITGPGTGTSDDVPAMLSDGEFVMTAQAVRGAGGGSREKGVRNMMDLMKNFEMRAA